MTLNCIWWWGSSPGDLESMEYLLTAIIPRSTMTWRDCTYQVQSMGQTDLFKNCSYLIGILDAIYLQIIWIKNNLVDSIPAN